MTFECYYFLDISSRGLIVRKELAGPEGFSDVPHLLVLMVHAPAGELEVDKGLNVPGGVNSVLGDSVLTVPALAEGLEELKEMFEV